MYSSVTSPYTYLMNFGSSWHVISNAIYSIQWAHSTFGYSDSTMHPFIKSLLDSSKLYNTPKIIKKGPTSTSDLVNLCDLFKSTSEICACFWFPSLVFLRFDQLSYLLWVPICVFGMCSFKKAWPAKKDKGKKYIDSMVCYIFCSSKDGYVKDYLESLISVSKK